MLEPYSGMPILSPASHTGIVPNLTTAPQLFHIHNATWVTTAMVTMMTNMIIMTTTVLLGTI